MAEYGGLLGAFPYAFRQSDSRLLRSYVLVGGVLAALVTVIFTAALVVLTFETLGGPGGTFTFSRALFVLVGFLVVAPLVAPVLLVARRHRRAGSDARYDAALAGTGYLFVLALYLGLVVSTPPEQQEAPPALVAPVVDALYGLPPAFGVLPPVVAGVLVLVVHRRLR